MTLKVGKLLQNRYEIRNILDDLGTFSIVYRAYDQWLKSEVAIKEFNPLVYGGSEDAMFKRFKREARITRRLQHAHIIEIYDLFWANDTLYLVMPFLVDTLDQRLRETGYFPLDQALDVMLQISEGVTYAHTAFLDKNGRGAVVHCDLKPGNILFDQHNQVKITDFGIAYIPPIPGMVETLGGGMTGAGTIAYMAPEQLEGKCNDPRLDVYALGALFYHILTGRYYLDFEGEFTQEIYEKNKALIRTGTPLIRPLREKDVPHALIKIISRALEKDPQKRYAHAGEMLEELQAYVEDAPALSHLLFEQLPYPDNKWAESSASPSNAAGPSSTSFKVPVLVLIALALLATFIGGSMMLSSFTATNPTPTAVSLITSTSIASSPSASMPSSTLASTLPNTLAPTYSPTPMLTSAPSNTPLFTPSDTPVATLTPCTIAAPINWTRYIVRAGDTLSSLATRYSTTVADIIRYNCLPDTTIRVGQLLYLPAPPTPIVVTLTPSILPATPTTAATPTGISTATPTVLVVTATPSISTPIITSTLSTPTFLPSTSSPTPILTSVTPTLLPNPDVTPTSTGNPTVTPDETPQPTFTLTPLPPASFTPTLLVSPTPTASPTLLVSPSSTSTSEP
ncbi:MAG: protein kinase [Anaerolineae bacterium]|nr:protein kinase [Anaerolineae bacterium]